MRFKTKPVFIEATQWFPGVNIEGVTEIQYDSRGEREPRGTFGIRTRDGLRYLTAGYWVVTATDGTRTLCDPDVFAATYEPAEKRATRAGSK